jgi:hypothetical protein
MVCKWSPNNFKKFENCWECISMMMMQRYLVGKMLATKLKPTVINKYYVIYIKKGKKVKWSRFRPRVAQRVGRGIALLFHDRGTRSGWVVSSTPRPQFTPRKDSVTILQEAGGVPGLVWTEGKSRPQRDSIPDRPARVQLLYRLS